MSSTTAGWRIRRTDAGEDGAVLVLALIFMVASALLTVGLLTWSGNDLQSVAAFQQSRELNYAANSAMQTAIQQVRYSTTACPSSGLSFPSANGLTIDIWCNPPSPQAEGGTNASRRITFTACSSTAVTAHTCSSSNPYLQAIVSYDDYSSTGPNPQLIAGVPCSNTCGTTMKIDSWVFAQTSL